MSDLEAELHDLRQRSGQLSDGRVLGASIIDGRIDVEVELTPGVKQVWARLCVTAGGQGGGVFRVPSAGDTVQVLMIDGDPTDARVVGWTPTGAMRLPDGFSAGSTYVVAVPGENVRVLASEGGTIRVETDGPVEVEGDSIRLGDGAGQRVALADDVKREIQALWDALSSHTHPVLNATPADPTKPVIATTATTAGSAGDVGADKVSAE